MTDFNIGQYISFEDLVARCEAKGIDIENNALIASRMPPGLACGMHPAGYTNADMLLGKDSKFVFDLGPAATRLKNIFDAAAPDTVKFAMDFTSPQFKPPVNNG